MPKLYCIFIECFISGVVVGMVIATIIGILAMRAGIRRQR